jgi:acyl carrier protein
MNDHLHAKVRQLLAEYGQLPVDVAFLGDRSDLYAAGLKSLAVVQLMLALEAEFGVEFPDHRLNRRTFANISTIEGCVRELLPRALGQ